jgi:hypothetical protein
MASYKMLLADECQDILHIIVKNEIDSYTLIETKS